MHLNFRGAFFIFVKNENAMTINDIEKSIDPLKNQLLNHSLYNKIKSIEDLEIFLQHHVYAVWDFMSLLKALQNKLTCTTIPWLPTKHPETRYLINEIVLAEETDVDINGNHKSHYEMYLDAMEACGVSTTNIKTFLETSESLGNIFVAIRNSDLPQSLKDFLEFTFNVAIEGQPHQIAAAFTFGREDLIPNMFTEILKNFQQNFPEKDLSKLVYYFERHIELDADEHGPMALQMIEELCENDEKKWKEVEEISIEALQKRIALWDGIENAILESKEVVSL